MSEQSRSFLPPYTARDLPLPPPSWSYWGTCVQCASRATFHMGPGIQNPVPTVWVLCPNCGTVVVLTLEDEPSRP